MTKYELTEKLVDRLVDPWTDCPEDYAEAEPIDLAYAETMLNDMLHDDDEMEDPDYCVPEGTTPELLMEVYNCLIRCRKHQLHVQNMAEYLTDNEMVCEYDQYKDEYDPNAVTVLPVDFLFNEDEFPFETIDDSHASPLFLIELGQRSPEFCPDHDFCWYDKQKNQLFSSDEPFHDGVIDACAFAEYIMSPDGHDCLDYLVNSIMDDDDIWHVFRCSEAEVRKIYLLS